MGFDVAIGASQDQLNSVGAVLYKQLYPNLFTGSVKVPTLDLTVAYDIKQAPAIFLAPPSGALMSALAAPAGQGSGPEAAQAGARAEGLVAGLMASTVLFTIAVDDVALTLTAANGKQDRLTVSATAVCQADVDESTGHIRLTALHVNVPQWSDPTVQWVLENVISPEAMKILNGYLEGVTLPPLTVAGVKLNVPIAFIDGGRLIAMTTLQRSGPPVPPPHGASWPSGEFFTLMSTAAADAAAAYQVAQLNPHFKNEGSASWTAFTVSWGYDLTLGDPAIGIAGGGYHLGMKLSGGVNAGLSAHLVVLNPSIHFGVGFTTKPDPGGTVGLSVDSGNGIVLRIQHVDAFGIAIQLPGLPSWANEAIGWVTSAITEGLTGSLVPAVNAFIGALHFRVFTIPDISVNAGPVHVKVAPADLQVAAFDGLISATGRLEIRPA